MTPSVTLVRVFDRSWGAWRRGVEACRRKPTRRGVHQLRIDCRRLEALLEVLDHTTGVPAKGLRRLGDVAAEALDALSKLRDDQVHRRRVADAGNGRGVEALVEDIRRREARHKKRARKALGAIDLARADAVADKVRHDVVRRQGTPTPHDRTVLLLAAVEGAASTVRSRLALVDAARPRTLHRLRLAIKRFRYVAEIAEEVGPEVRVAARPTLQSLQRQLGAVHDADVLADRIARFGRRRRQHRADVRALLTRVESDRARRMRGLSGTLAALRNAVTAPAV
jgi:CHAD domain-containing protein